MSSHTGSSSSSSPNSPQSPAGFRSFSFRLLLGLTLAALVTGVFSGLGAIALHYVLDFMQELTFGQAEGHHPMVTDGADPARRALVLAALGPFVALVWYYLQSGGRRVVGVKSQIAGATEEDRAPSLWRQISHSVIQIVAVGAGSPVGKEVAPRELGALAAGRCARFWSVWVVPARMIRCCWVIVSVACWWRRVRRPVWRRCIRCRLVAWCTLWRRWLVGLSLRSL